MKKFLLIFSFSLIAWMVSYANTELIVWQDNGSQAKFSFKDRPIISHKNDSLIVSSNETEVKFAISNIVKLTFESDGVNIIKDANKTQAINIVNNKITFVNTKGTINVYSINGQIILQKTITNENEVTLNLSELPKGVYIISNNKTTLKYSKK